MASGIALETEQTLTDRLFMKSAIQIAQGAAWLGFAVVVGAILEYVTQRLIAVRLGPEGFGLFNLGLRVTTLTVTLAVLSLPNTVTYFIPRLKTQDNTEQVNRLVSLSIWLPLLISFIIGFGLFLAAEPIATKLLDEPDLTSILQLFAVTVPSSVLVLILVGNLRGLKRSQEASLLANSYERAFRLVFIVVFFALGLNLNAPVLAYLPASLIVVFLGLRYLRKTGIRFTLARPSGIMQRQILNYTWPLLVSQVFNQLIPAVQPLLLARFQGAHAVGLYSAAWLIGPQLFTMVVVIFGFLYLPVISELTSSGDKQNLRRLYWLVTIWQIIVVLPAYLLIVSLPGETLGLIGSEFGEAKWALILMVTTPVISISFGPNGHTLLATGHSGVYLLLNMAGAFVSIVSGLIFIPLWGLVGAALGYMVSISVWNILTWSVVYRKYRIHLFWRQYLIVILTALAVGLPMYPVLRAATQVTPWLIVVAIPPYTGLFVFILIKLKLLDTDSQQIANQFIQLLLERVEVAHVHLHQKIKGSSDKE